MSALKWQARAAMDQDPAPNALPRWCLYTEEFPDTTGQEGAGIVTHSVNTFAYLRARPEVLDELLPAVNNHQRLRDSRIELANAAHGLLMLICLEASDRISSDEPAVKAAQAAIKKVNEETLR